VNYIKKCYQTGSLSYGTIPHTKHLNLKCTEPKQSIHLKCIERRIKPTKCSNIK